MRPEDVTIITWLGTMVLLLVIAALLIFQIAEVKDKLAVAEIAGIRVPPISCAEDEVISWTGPDALGCVHFEEVR